MTPLSRAADFLLPSEGAELLQRLLDGEEARIREALAQRTFAGPVCALALVYVWYADVPTASYTCALSESARDAAFARHDEQGLRLLWHPADWDHADILDPVPDAVYEEAERLAAALKDAGCEDPEGAFVCELAHRLSRGDWSGVIQVTENFACWAMEHELNDDVLDTFRVTALPATVSAFSARGWLRLPHGHAPEF